MAWWAWVSVVLVWAAAASGFALWLGDAAVVVQRRERAATAHFRDDDPALWVWRDAG